MFDRPLIRRVLCLDTVLPRWTNLCTASETLLFTSIVVGIYGLTDAGCNVTTVFFRLIVSPNSSPTTERNPFVVAI